MQKDKERVKEKPIQDLVDGRRVVGGSLSLKIWLQAVQADGTR